MTLVETNGGSAGARKGKLEVWGEEMTIECSVAFSRRITGLLIYRLHPGSSFTKRHWCAGQNKYKSRTISTANQRGHCIKHYLFQSALKIVIFIDNETANFCDPIISIISQFFVCTE